MFVERKETELAERKSAQIAVSVFNTQEEYIEYRIQHLFLFLCVGFFFFLVGVGGGGGGGTGVRGGGESGGEGLRPLQEYFTYIEPIVHKGGQKPKNPGKKTPDHP